MTAAAQLGLFGPDRSVAAPPARAKPPRGRSAEHANAAGEPLDNFRALSLWRPWPWVILKAPPRRQKRVENRPWRPYDDVIGEVIALHAAQKYDDEAAEWMRDVGLDPPADGDDPAQRVVGVARVVGWVSESGTGVGDHAAMRAARRSEYFCGPIGWLLADVFALPEPVRCGGAQKLWYLPLGVGAAVRAQIPAGIVPPARRAA